MESPDDFHPSLAGHSGQLRREITVYIVEMHNIRGKIIEYPTERIAYVSHTENSLHCLQFLADRTGKLYLRSKICRPFRSHVLWIIHRENSRVKILFVQKTFKIHGTDTISPAGIIKLIDNQNSILHLLHKRRVNVFPSSIKTDQSHLYCIRQSGFNGTDNKTTPAMRCTTAGVGIISLNNSYGTSSVGHYRPEVADALLRIPALAESP